MTAAPAKDRYLEGRCALVTGGASGIGRAIARALAEAGARVALGSLLEGAAKLSGELAHHPSRDDLDGAREELEALGVDCVAADLDVASTDSVWGFIERVEAELGPVDILVNAAGVTAEQPTVGHAEDLWRKVIEVCLHGTFRTTRRCLPGMIDRRWGRVINLAATAGATGRASNPAYCAATSGVVGFTRSVALEGAPYGVTANTVSPGWVETPLGRSWMTHIAEMAEGTSGAAFMAEQKANNPQGRMIQPVELGALAAFLCRDDAVGITMQDLTVTAGALA